MRYLALAAGRASCLATCPADPVAGTPVPQTLPAKEALRMARNSAWLLRHRQEPAVKWDTKGAVFELLRAKGWTRNREVRVPDLAVALEERLGPHVLDVHWKGTASQENRHRGLRELFEHSFRLHHRVCPPVRYLLLLAFLDEPASSLFRARRYIGASRERERVAAVS